jgi:hypothetical protein
VLKPLTMSFFAMLNWHCPWHREGGPLSRDDYARLVATLIAEGTPAVLEAFRPAEGRARDRMQISLDFTTLFLYLFYRFICPVPDKGGGKWRLC